MPSPAPMDLCDKHKTHPTWRFYEDSDASWVWEFRSAGGQLILRSSRAFEDLDGCLSDAVAQDVEAPSPCRRHGNAASPMMAQALET
jgi:hypothetical protein